MFADATCMHSLDPTGVNNDIASLLPEILFKSAAEEKQFDYWDYSPQLNQFLGCIWAEGYCYTSLLFENATWVRQPGWVRNKG